MSLRSAAEHLDVHYMTIYRYVRTGRLPATKRDGQWYVDLADIDDLVVGSNPATRDGSRTRAAAQVEDRMLAADETGAWSVIQQALTSGAEPADIHLQLIIPAMQSIGDRWDDQLEMDFDEHQATAVATRLVARLGPRFRVRGEARGHVVVGLVVGDTHALTTAIMADLLRCRGVEVTDLGADTPPESFVDVFDSRPLPLVAVAISASTSGSDDVLRATVEAVRARRSDLPIAIGGAGITDLDHAVALGDTVGATDFGELVSAVDRLADEAAADRQPNRDEQAFGVLESR